MKILSYKLFAITLCSITLGLTILSPLAHASTLVFQNKVVNVKLGDTFRMPVSIDPSGEKNYTTRLTFTFSPKILEITSFSFAKNWMAVSQPGYDLIDNKGGNLIKTAGYPAGFSGAVPFGTITFRAKKVGVDVVTVGLKSFILNAASKSTLASRPQVRVIVVEGQSPIAPPSIQPLPNLPPEEKNIFDIIMSPGQTTGGPGILFFILLIIIAAFFGIIGRILFVGLKRRTVKQKTKHDTGLKK